MGEGVGLDENKGSDIYSLICESFGEPKTPLKAQSPLTLAFIGDGIYSLIARSIVVNQGNTANGKLHNKSLEYVSARAQSRVAGVWLEGDILTQEERDILNRGMNAKPHSLPKSASHFDYHRATGVEALSGYLYQKGELERLIYLIKEGLKQS